MCLERRQLGPQPGASRRVVDLGAQAPQQVGGICDQARGCGELLGVDLGLEVGRSEVAVDQPGQPLVEAECQEQVVARDRVRCRYPALSADGGHLHANAHGPGSLLPTGCDSPPSWPSSPTNGIPWRSTASRLIRRAAVFCSATSRT